LRSVWYWRTAAGSVARWPSSHAPNLVADDILSKPIQTPVHPLAPCFLSPASSSRPPARGIQSVSAAGRPGLTENPTRKGMDSWCSRRFKDAGRRTPGEGSSCSPSPINKRLPHDLLLRLQEEPSRISASSRLGERFAEIHNERPVLVFLRNELVIFLPRRALGVRTAIWESALNGHSSVHYPVAEKQNTSSSSRTRRTGRSL